MYDSYKAAKPAKGRKIKDMNSNNLDMTIKRALAPKSFTSLSIWLNINYSLIMLTQNNTLCSVFNNFYFLL